MPTLLWCQPGAQYPMRWPFTRKTTRAVLRSVSLDEGETIKPNQVRFALAGGAKPDRTWTGGRFDDVGVTDIAALDIPIDRQFPSVAAMFHAVITSIPERERLDR